MKKLFSINTCILILTGLLVFCSTSLAAYPVTIQDSKGNSLTFFAPPKRVVSIVPAATEMLFAIGGKEAVKAITIYDTGIAGTQGKQIIGGFLNPSLDKIKALLPDMIILSSIHKDIIKKYTKTDTKLFVFQTDTLENSYKSIATFGKIFDREKKAETVIEKNKGQINLIKQKLTRIDPKKKKRVIRLMGKDSVMTPGKDSFQNEIILAAGGIPPDFGKKGNIVSVTKQEWIKFNPQVIYGCGPDKEVAKKNFSKPGWKDVDAIKNNQIYYFPCELTCRASTHTGYFASWLSSVIYSDYFSKPENNVLSTQIIDSKPVKIDLDYIKSASIAYSYIHDFKNKTLIIDFKSPQKIVSTLEGQRDNITSIGNHFLPPPTWALLNKSGIEHTKASILKTIQREKQNTSFLITGADMDNISLKSQTYKDMKVYALVTAGVRGNAVRMSKDTADFYEPGTINIIVLTNMKLSPRAMTRAIISGTEGKTAALEDMDIRSSYTPLKNEATGTGTDNILVVQGEGLQIENTGGHSKMGELIAKAVYEGVKEAVLNQNHIFAKRDIFQRLKERNLSIYKLATGAICECKGNPNELVAFLEQLLLEPKYASFIESSLAISDEYEKGLINNLDSFYYWCSKMTDKIAGYQIEKVENMVSDKTLPITLKAAFNAILNGAQARLSLSPPHENGMIYQRVISLSPIITETIYLLNAQDLLVANTTYCNVPDQAKFKEKIGSVIQMNVEKIIGLKPDLVIASPLSNGKQIQILQNQNIKVIKIENPKTFPQMCELTMKIGQLLGQTARAKEIISSATEKVEAIKVKTQFLPKKKVFIQIGMKPLHSASKDTFINEYIKYGGGINIAENEKSGIYSREKVLKENPDLILIATMGTSKKAAEIEKQRWMEFTSLNAAKKNQIYVLDPELILSPTPVTFAKGLKQVLSLIHPMVD
ncbi:helical backbone metal receptor [Desulfobacula sp.]